MSDSDDDQEPVAYTFNGEDLLISTAENEFNKGKKTLFATYVWSGSIVLSNLLCDLYRDLIVDKSVVEFGAAAGIPSVVAAKIGAKRVIATDYPSKSVLRNLRKNCERNGVTDRVRVTEYIWGEDATPVVQLNDGELFDVALATECLWRHESHQSLIDSAKSLLRIGGVLLLTYSHHVPGFEEQDDAFLSMAEAQGFSIDSKEQMEAPHMWSDQKMSTIYCVRFTKHE